MIYMTPAIALALAPSEENAPWIGYDTVVTFTNITADEEAAGFPVTNLSNTSTAEKWRGTTTGAQGVTVQEGATQECDYFGVAKHNFGSTGAVIKLQTSPDGDVWTDVTDDIAPGNDYAIMFRFTAQQAEFWRLYITPGTAAPEIAVFYLGTLLVGERRIYVGHTPLVLGRNQVTATGKSDSGQFLGRVLRREFLKSSVDFKNLSAAWYREHFDPFAEASATQPFFWAWRPGTYPTEVGYAWVQGGVTPSNQSPNGHMSVTFEMEGVR
jgi:hypothetical protein